MTIVTVVLVSLACHLRGSLAASTRWHCDEIPLLVRFTGLCGAVTREADAATFVPTWHSFRMGALRSFHVPDYLFSAHTTTNFWTNLGIHIFGMGPVGGRAGSLFWSVVAIVSAVCAARLAGGGALAASVAALVVAMSPFATAYAAQTRGYSESMAMTPLLLIALEYLRRNPRSPLRAVVALVCALQLSLTVYTTWLFWVLPVLVMAVFLLPRNADFGDERAQLRLGVSLIAAAVVLFMAVFTAERWKTLTFASQNGERYAALSQWIEFLVRYARQSFAGAEVTVALTLLGMMSLWLSPVRWWTWAIAAGVAMPILFGWWNRSPGYARNLTYLIVPVAILSGLGAEGVARLLARFASRRAISSAVTILIGGLATGAYAGLENRARAILLPDWGEVVTRFEDEPTDGIPRWFCPCEANHWQIDWYASRDDSASAAWNVPVGDELEVAMGAQLREDGTPLVYGYDPARKFIAEQPLPAFLAGETPADVSWGIELRRWRAHRVAATDGLSEGPAFLLLRTARAAPASAWDRFLDDRSVREHGIVAFRERPVDDGVLQSFLVPAAAVRETLLALRAHFDVDDAAVHLFRLRP